MRRVRQTIEKLFLVLDFLFETFNEDSPSTNPDVLMLQLSSHKNKNDESIQTIDLIEVENLEMKLNQIVDRILTIRSEILARQFLNETKSFD